MKIWDSVYTCYDTGFGMVGFQTLREKHFLINCGSHLIRGQLRLEVDKFIYNVVIIEMVWGGGGAANLAK